MSEKDVFGPDDLRILDEIAHRTFDELAGIPTAPPDIEALIQALSEAAERLSEITYEALSSEDPLIHEKKQLKM